MAQKVTVTLTDDIDGTEASETVTFALDGVTYEVDLNEKNSKALRGALETYIGAGRKISGASKRGGGTSRRSSANSDLDLNAAREWLRSQGHQVSDRGRIKADLLDLYRKSL